MPQKCLLFCEQSNRFLALVEMPGKRGTGGQLPCNMTTSVISKLDLCLISSSMSMCPVPFMKGAVGKDTHSPFDGQDVSVHPVRDTCVSQVKDDHRHVT